MRNRENKLYFYLSDEELKGLNDRVKELGIQNRSNYIRKMILDGYVVSLDTEPVRELISLLRHCGNNLNQYAKVANASGRIYASDIADLREEFDEIRAMMKKLVGEMTKV